LQDGITEMIKAEFKTSHKECCGCSGHKDKQKAA
jgi:hypothetical protein